MSRLSCMIIVSFLIILSFGVFQNGAFCEEELGAAANEPGQAPTVVAPGGLTEREQSALQKQYRFQVRNKAQLLKPLAGSPETFMLPDWETQRDISKKELLYRYFGAAAQMKEEGKYDEAIEVLQYIASQDPKDKYVANYLKRTIKERDKTEKEWKKEVANDARIMKNETVTQLLSDGQEFYDNGKHDEALAAFSDVLAVDPENPKAKRYMAILKDEYKKKIAIERVVQKYEEQPGVPGETAQDEQNGPLGDISGEEALSDGKAELQIDRKLADNGGILPGGGSAGGKEALKLKAGSVLDEKEVETEIAQIVAAQKEKTYRLEASTIGEGDVISIVVVGHPELSGDVMVPYGGKTKMPLTEEYINFNGLTTTEAAEAVTKVMEKFVRDPEVQVEIKEYRSKLFYVIDDMGCTPYPITRPDMTLRDALFVADWGTNKALGRVILVSPHKLKPVVRKIDAFDLIYRGRLAHNPKIKDGDVIYVPMTVAGKTAQVISDTTAPFSEMQNARNLWLQGKWTRKGQASMFRIYPDSQRLPEVVGATGTGQ